MSVQFNNKEYLVGPAYEFRTIPSNYTHLGYSRYENQSCPVFRDDTNGTLTLSVQYLNTQWPTFYPLRTKARLLEGWS